MRSLVKTALYFVFYLLNFFTKKPPEVSVLMYHSIENSGWKYSVKKENFKKQVGYLARHYNIVPLERVVEYIKGKAILPDKSVAITFDDGYEGIYTEVFPAIKQKNVPITVFLTTNLEKKEKLGNLERLTWPQIKEMHQSGLVKFEVHGREHLNLKQISQNGNLLRDEIIGSFEDIKSKIGYEPKYIAYPAGHRNRKVIDFLKKNNFQAGFSINEGLVKPGSDVYNIKRTQIDGTMNFYLFKMRLTGAVDLNRKFVDYLRRLL